MGCQILVMVTLLMLLTIPASNTRTAKDVRENDLVMIASANSKDTDMEKEMETNTAEMNQIHAKEHFASVISNSPKSTSEPKMFSMINTTCFGVSVDGNQK